MTDAVISLGHKAKESDIEDMITQLDADKSGTVDFPEFLNMMAKTMHNTEEADDLRQAFNVFDDNNDGFIRLTDDVKECGVNHCDF